MILRLLPYHFVLEVQAINGKDLARVYIVDPSPTQFYRTTDLHAHLHYLLEGELEVAMKEEELEKKGLRKVTADDLMNDPGLVGVYVRLSSDGDHFLPEMTVVNDLTSPKFVKAIAALRLKEIGEHAARMNILGDETENSRGNGGINWGFPQANSKDKTTLRGINAPLFTSYWNKYPGLAGDTTFTQTVLKSAVAMTLFVRLLKEEHGLVWDDFEGDADDRVWMFPQRVARTHGIPNWKDNIIQGGTIGFNGMMPDGKVYVLNPHRDSNNARDAPYNAYWGLVMYVDLEYPTVLAPDVRIAFGGYGKTSISSIYRKLPIFENIRQGLEGIRRKYPDLFVPRTPPLFGDSDGPIYSYPPHMDKFVFFSPFLWVLLALGEETNFDLAALFEAVFVMGLTNCPEAWCTGVRYALKNRRGRNLCVAFIEGLLENRGSVAKGEGRRRQPSAGGNITARAMFLSLRNMLRLVEKANTTGTEATTEIFDTWADSPEKGGVSKAGHLTASEQMNILTALGVVHQTVHRDNAFVCKGTATYQRLEEMGVVGKDWKPQLFHYLSCWFGVDWGTVENMLCELGRHENGSLGWADTFLKGQPVFTLEGDELFAVGSKGVKKRVDIPSNWNFRSVKEYEHGVVWWEDKFDVAVCKTEVYALRLTLS